MVCRKELSPSIMPATNAPSAGDRPRKEVHQAAPRAIVNAASVNNSPE